MKSNNNPPNESRVSRVLSPTLRTGPRQRPPDASTDEIVRFVREHQRRGHTQPPNYVNGLRSRAVLPGIERKWPQAAPPDANRWSINEEDYRHSSDSNSSKTDIGNHDAGTRNISSSFEPEIIGRGSLQLENKSDTTSDRLNAKKRHSYQNWSEFEVDGKHSHNDFDREGNSKRNLDLDTFLEGTNGSNMTGKRLNVRNGKKGNAKTISELQNHYTTYRPASLVQPIREIGSLRPLALRQLPPIMHQSHDPDLQPSRPSAPSPVDLSPEYQIDSCSDSFEEIEDEQDAEEEGGDALIVEVDDDSDDDYDGKSESQAENEYARRDKDV